MAADRPGGSQRAPVVSSPAGDPLPLRAPAPRNLHLGRPLRPRTWPTRLPVLQPHSEPHTTPNPGGRYLSALQARTSPLGPEFQLAYGVPGPPPQPIHGGALLFPRMIGPCAQPSTQNPTLLLFFAFFLRSLRLPIGLSSRGLVLQHCQ